MAKKAKTKKKASCASKRAYAKGPKKNKCVPKGGAKAKTRRSKKCYADSRADAVNKLQLYDKNKAKRAEKQAKLAFDKRVESEENAAKYGLSGLHGRRRRRHRRR